MERFLDQPCRENVGRMITTMELGKQYLIIFSHCKSYTDIVDFREMPEMTRNHFSAAMVTIRSEGFENGLFIAGGSAPRNKVTEFFAGEKWTESTPLPTTLSR